MKCKITRLLSLFVVMFTMCLPSFAYSNYYSKVVANAVGEGKVYASTSSTNNPSYKEGSSSATNNTNATSAPDHTYYVYAQAKDGNEFAGWYENEACTGNPVSKESTYKVTVKAESTKQNSPTTKNYYAKFVDASTPILGYGETRVYANLSSGTYKNNTLTAKNVSQVSYESSNENVATIAADGTVTLKKNGSCIIEAKASNLETSYTLTVIDDVAAGVTQIGNGDFEDWRGVSSSNHAPDNWNSFETAEGSFASLSSAQQVDVIEGGRPGSDGLYCVDIWARSVLGIVAQGSLTTGCLNAGATQASAKGNNSFSKISDPKKSETLSKVPTAIKMWVKFVPKASGTPKALVTATVHDAHNYVTYSKDDYDDDANRGYAIAKAKWEFEACDWTELTIPFDLTGNTTDGQMYILLNIATSNIPGEGAADDHLYIDDVELVYDPLPVIYNKYISVAHEAPVQAPIEVTYNDNNTIDFGLKNFGIDLGGTYAYVGNIAVPGLAIDGDGNFSFDGSIKITAGDKEGVNKEEWIGPGMGDIPVVLNGTIKGDYFYVHLDINIPGVPVVEVEAGDLANATVSVSEALKGTFCAPFTVAIPSNYQSVVTASTVTGQTNGVLALEPVQNGVIPANTPVVVEALQAFDMDVSGIYVKGTPEEGLLTGVYEPNGEHAPVGSYVLQNNNGKVGFFKVVDGNKLPIVGKNRCYLKDQGSNVKAFYFNEEDATGIENVNVNDNANANEGAIYNVAGQRINKLQKGINIINGKKILK